MDGIRFQPNLVATPTPSSWPPPVAPSKPGPADSVQPSRDGAADWFRDMARLRLQSVEPNPSEGLVELTALQLAENKYLQSGAPLPGPSQPQSARGMLGSASYLNALAACQMGAPAGLGPVLAKVLADLDPFKIFGPQHQDGGNSWIVAGHSLQNQIKASQAAGTQTVLRGIQVTGILDPKEADLLEGALQPLQERLGETRLRGLVKNLHVQTLLGEMMVPGKNWLMGGLGGGGQVALSRDSLRNPEALRDNLAHEVGHLVDEEIGAVNGCRRISERPDSPFGKGASAQDFTRDYGTLNPSEDFADCHADLMKNWHSYKAYPQLCMLSRGQYGEKLAYIARLGYHWQVPPPDLRLQQMAEKVRTGLSPFGYVDELGLVREAEPGLQRAMTAFVDHVNGDGQLSADFLQKAPTAEKAARLWLFNEIYAKENPQIQANRVDGVVGDLARMSHLDAQSAEHREMGSQVLTRLEMGGPNYLESARRYVAQNYQGQAADYLQGRLNQYAEVAAPNWKPL